ncbi:MAG TPA: Crp/Fnr family transcriptional regulator [Sphingobacteriaceae bacterium]
MYERFLQKLNEKVSLLPEEEDYIREKLTFKKLRRRQYLLQDGDICKSIAFVEKGALKAYLLDEKGNEHITAFAFEGWTMADLYSFFREEPATLNIDAVEDCELVMISKAAHEELLDQLPKYERYIRLLMTDAYIALQRRTAQMNQSSEERYLAFLDIYPDIAQRIPQHMIASYLGLSPETVSRLRSRMSKK